MSRVLPSLPSLSASARYRRCCCCSCCSCCRRPAASFPSDTSHLDRGQNNNNNNNKKKRKEAFSRLFKLSSKNEQDTLVLLRWCNFTLMSSEEILINHSYFYLKILNVRLSSPFNLLKLWNSYFFEVFRIKHCNPLFDHCVLSFDICGKSVMESEQFRV